MKNVPSTAELLTQQFYDWERRGRGWDVWPECVELEPPFQPFVGHVLPRQEYLDDGRVPNLFVRFGGALRRLWRKSESPPQPEAPESQEKAREHVFLQVSLPSDSKGSCSVFGQFLSSLRYRRGPVAFEMVGNTDSICTQMVVHQGDERLVESQLRAHFPDVHVEQTGDAFKNAFLPELEGELVLVDFGLAHEFMLPLRTASEFVVDSHVALIGALDNLGDHEAGMFQVLFQPVRHPWPTSILQVVSDGNGESFFADAPELLDQAKKKVTSPLYAAVIRAAARGSSFEEGWEILRNLAEALGNFASVRGNELIPLTNEGYDWVDHVLDLLDRRSHRSGMLLNAEELTGFIHLPGSEVVSNKLRRQRFRSRPAPAVVLDESGLLLGENQYRGKIQEVRLNADQRVRHMHVVGASGTGKSTFLLNLIRQDINNGQGVAVLDPHGDLVENVLATIPPERIGDVVLLDPADEEYPIGLNILTAHSSLEKTLLASDLVSVFERLSTSWGDQMGSVLNNAILAFLESREGGTLADLRRFMLEPQFRTKFLETVEDPEVVYYWRRAFPQLTGNRSVGPIVTRLESFLSPKPIRYMVSQKVNRVRFGEIMDESKILLAKLSQGAIGKENSFLLGSLLVAKLQQLAVSRQSQEESRRRYFWLYIDEFHNFITPSMAEILSGARKYRLGLILAHQELHQLQRDSDVASAVLSNACCRVCFRVGDHDARSLSSGFSSFESIDLQNLANGEAICRVERSNFDFNLKVPLPNPVDQEDARSRRSSIVRAVREQYATPRSELVESLSFEIPEDETEDPRPRRKVRREPAPPESRESKPVSAPGPPPESIQEPSPTQKPAEEIPTPDQTIHEALKDQLIAAGEQHFYNVTREHTVLDGAGRVDLVFTRGKQSIACEIAVTTTVDWEVGNVRKCLRAGFPKVVVIAPNDTRLEKLRAAMEAELKKSELKKVSFHLPHSFQNELEKWARRDPEGGEIERAKPRKQKLEFPHSSMTESERKQKEIQMLQDLAAAMKGGRPNP